jgi:tetratricopeptide (TPR) repeat protein
MMLDVFSYAAKNKDLFSLQLSYKKMHRETRQLSLNTKWHSFLGALALAQANHQALRNLSFCLIQSSDVFGYYLLAQSQFLLGDFESSLISIDQYLKPYPDHPDACYLKSNILKELGQPERAWQVLETLSQHSKRLKTWMYMANLVNTESDYNRLIKNHRLAQSTQKVPTFNTNVSQFLSIGAMRCKHYVAAYELWNEILQYKLLNTSKNFKNKKLKSSTFSTKHAEIALKDLNKLLKTNQIEMFLVSGTLLGCIREGKLLGHDKDVDVGVWSDVANDVLLNIIKASGCFYVQASRAKEIIRIKHVNGTAIDVFYHYKEQSTYWHGGVKVKWHNSPFTLKPHYFLGDEYLIPENYDQYLTENYGSWRQPVIDFDSAFDTPNAEVINTDEMCIHAYRMLAKNLYTQQSGRYKRYLIKNGRGNTLLSQIV